MELYQAIRQRRSIRKYQNKKIASSLIESLVEKALWAPTGSNMQAWKFIIVDDGNQLEKIKLFSPGLLGEPPAVIVVCIDRWRAAKKAGRFGENELSYFDAALVTLNNCLLALEYELGTCIVASFNKNAIKELLELPDEVSPYLCISIGYPEKIPSPPRRISLSEVISWQKYEKRDCDEQAGA